jgi:putative aldouronate transport system substrate-binding protein
VTGVQTCALPISVPVPAAVFRQGDHSGRGERIIPPFLPSGRVDCGFRAKSLKIKTHCSRSEGGKDMERTRARKWKWRAASAVLALALVLLAGCSTNALPSASAAGSPAPSASAATAVPEVTQNAEKLQVRYVVPGDLPTDEAAVEAAINSKLQQDGLNLEFKEQNVPWDAWDQKTNLMLSTGEEFEMMEVMQDVIPLSSYAGRSATTSLDGFLDKYGQDIKKIVPDYLWNCVKYNGAVVAVPANWLPMQSAVEYITMRTDLLKKYNLAVPKTPDDLLNACEVIGKGETELKPKAWAKMVTDASDFLHRSYAAWPFTVFQEVVYADQNGNVKPWIETDEFMQDAKFWRKLYTEGLVDPDILTISSDIHMKNVDEGRFLFEHSVALGEWPSIHTNLPDATIQLVLLNPDKPKFDYIGSRNMNIVPSTCKHPEAPIQFLNWLYANQDNYDLLLNGIKDKDWKDSSVQLVWNGLTSNTIETITDPQTNSALYYGPEWMIGQMNYKKWPSSSHPQWLEVYQPVSSDTISSVTLGFNFDTTKVASEYANVLAQIKAVIWPIKYGVVDYDQAFPAALQKLKDAGLEKVVAEYAEQFKAFMSTK